MKTDTLIRNEGMEILAKNLGLVEAERFIMLIQKEPFDSWRGVHTPPFRAIKKGMYPESSTYREQHTPSLQGGVVDVRPAWEITWR